MTVSSFEELDVWKKAKVLVVRVYALMEEVRDYGFRDQLQRAAISVMNNIAEGFERKGYKELRRFLYIAKGSSGEVRSMSYIALERNYINKEEFDEIHEGASEVSRMLAGFIKSLDS